MFTKPTTSFVFTRFSLILSLLVLLAACNQDTLIQPNPDLSDGTPLFTSDDLKTAVALKELSNVTVEGISLDNEQEALELPYEELNDVENELSAQAVLLGVEGWLVVWRVNPSGTYQIRRYDQTNDTGVTVYSGTEAVQSVAVDSSGTQVVASILDPATGNHDVHLFDLAMSTNFNVTNTAGKDEIDVSITKDGDKIAYGREHSSGKLRPYICDYDAVSQGCNLSNLSNFRDQYQPSISANGNFLAMIEDRPNNRYRVRVYDFGTNSYTDVQTRGDVLSHPSVDDSGEQVMYVRERDTAGAFSVRLKDLDANTVRSTLNDTVALDHPHITAPASHYVYGVFSPSSNTRKARTRDLTTNDFATPQGGNWNYFSPFWMMPVAEPSGSLDTSFGDGGKVTTDFFGGSDLAQELGFYNDKLVVIGTTSSSRFALARYNADGSLDSSFGSGGKVTTAGTGNAYGMVFDSSNRIIVAGAVNQPSTGTTFSLARYNSDGSLDTSFGTGGKVITIFSGDSRAHDVVIDSNNKIVVTGYLFGNQDFGLARYNPDGSLDSSFGTGGKVTTDFGGQDWPNALAIDNSGKLVVVGYSTDEGRDFALARYNPDGSLDGSFGTGGKVILDFIGGFQDQIFDLVIVGDKILVTGADGTFGDFALARFNADGSLDNSFGTDGKVTTNIETDGENGAEFSFTLELDSSNRIIVAGRTSKTTSASYDFALARYLPDGTLDSSFGTAGIVTTDFNQTYDQISWQGLAIDSSGRIVVAGQSASDFAVARYNP